MLKLKDFLQGYENGDTRLRDRYLSYPRAYRSGKTYVGAYFGIELELGGRYKTPFSRVTKFISENGITNTRLIQSYFERANLKYVAAHDPSVNGVEVISVPRHYNHRKQIGLQLEQLNLLYTGHNTNHSAGTHIHLNRAFYKNISDSRLLDLVRALNSFILYNPTFFELLGQRSFNWFNNRHDGKYRPIRPCFAIDDDNHGNKNTIEFRFMRSNLKKERIVKNIELAFAIMDYAVGTNPKGIYTHKWFCVSDFIAFVARQNKYSTLNSFIRQLQTKGIEYFNDIVQHEYENENLSHASLHLESYIDKCSDSSNRKYIYQVRTIAKELI